MRRLSTPLFLLLGVFTAKAFVPFGFVSKKPVDPRAFVLVFKTDNLSAGSSNADQVTLPLVIWASYNFTVSWGDGSPVSTVTSWDDPDKTHTYASPGIYIVTIRGDLDHFYFNNTGDRLKLLEVRQWGDIQWNSIDNAFLGCANMQITARDKPDLSGVASMAQTFRGASSMNANLNHWDVSTVTSMWAIFHGASSFNQPLNLWNTSLVTDMSQMFTGASSFNQDISGWNTSSAVTKYGIFEGAASFNQNIGAWNTINVNNMSSMFYNATSFNQNIGSWNTTNVTNMWSMFYGATSFNQDISSWNTANVTDMAQIFSGATSFNQFLCPWNVSSVTESWSYDLNATSWAFIGKPKAFGGGCP